MNCWKQRGNLEINSNLSFPQGAHIKDGEKCAGGGVMEGQEKAPKTTSLEHHNEFSVKKKYFQWHYEELEKRTLSFIPFL